MTRLFASLAAVLFVFSAGSGLGAQALREGGSRGVPARAGEAVSESGWAENGLPLKKITIYSSGVSFFEHSQSLTGPVTIRLPFKAAALNDALKSLMLSDPASAFPLISYSPEQGLSETLRSLGLNLSGNPGIVEILGNLRGEELEVRAPGPIQGRILSVEYRRNELGARGEPWLSLYTPQGIRLLDLSEVDSLRFTRAGLNADLERALDLIMASRNSGVRDLVISLPGAGSRPVSVSYVIPSPVWKVSYRLDLGPEGARFQGWAIVDNDSDEDWREVELSLAAGRPVSFIQNLYPPYYLDRPTLPLAIAGVSAAVAWDSSIRNAAEELNTTARMRSQAAVAALEYEPPLPAPAPIAAAPGQAPVSGADMADQFSFTLTEPVNLDRRTSAMFPLSDGEIGARKFLIFAGTQTDRAIHPSVGTELINSTGLRLPAGPVTVYDGGSYAGDALLEFLNRDEKRLISWGEDLSVNGVVSAASTRIVSSVNLSDGIMTISRRQGLERTYRFKNTGEEAKTLVIEHPINRGYSLVAPANYDEATASAYRFIRELPAGGASGPGEAELLVREEIPLSERISLLSQRPETLLSYATNQEIPPAVRSSLAEAVELKRRAEAADRIRAETESRKNSRAAEQDRIRRNLEAAGSGTPQGQEYLRRLSGLDEEIDRLNGDLEGQAEAAREAQAAYESYLRNLSF
jgi:hypothetical protein